MYNRKWFFDTVRPLYKRLYKSFSQQQVAGLEYLLSEFEQDDFSDREVAYFLATTLIETGGAMTPVEERGKGRGKPYGKPTGPFGKIYYGRGYPQLTWYDNYRKMGNLLDLPLASHPELLLKPDVAYRVMTVGADRGVFTGKRLGTYITETKTDWVGARRVINVQDRAKEIAGYAEIFHEALSHD